MGDQGALNLKVRIHCLQHIFNDRHKLLEGWQVGNRILYCRCGFYYPRMTDRTDNQNQTEEKFLTNTKAEELLSDYRKDL